MITISLHDAEFFAYHGFYPEEQKLGSKFVVDADVSFNPIGSLKHDQIANTVDYEKLYQIVCDEMKNTHKLIETVAERIADRVKKKFPFVDNIKVSIKKMNPPMNGTVGYSMITVSFP